MGHGGGGVENRYENRVGDMGTERNSTFDRRDNGGNGYGNNNGIRTSGRDNRRKTEIQRGDNQRRDNNTSIEGYVINRTGEHHFPF